jgi:hypothetical protein
MANPNDTPAPIKPLMAGCQQEPCSAFLTADQAAALHYGQRIWHAASDAQMCRSPIHKRKLVNGQTAVLATWLFGTVHEVNERGVQICPDGARKGTHIWFCGWLQVRVDRPENDYVWLDERRFGDSTPLAEVSWQNASSAPAAGSSGSTSTYLKS